jgi:probable HAF family extracellular repeat protein
MVSRARPSSPRTGVRLLLIAVAIAVSSDAVPTQSTFPSSYGIMDLGTAGGATATAHAVDEFGYAIVGSAQTAAGAHHAFIRGLWRNNGDLGTLGGTNSAAFAVYNLVVGQSQTATGQEHAFAVEWRDGTPVMQDLGTLGGAWSAAYGVHYHHGDYVVGASRTATNTLQAFRWSGGVMSPLPVNRGGDSVAKATLAGQTVGYACSAGNAACHAFSFSEGGGTVTNLGSLGGNSVANALNYNGQIVGVSALADKVTKHAFLHADGVMTDLGTLGGTNSEALGLNSRGEVVGVSDTASGPRAFLWRAGVMTDLNTLLPAGSGWVLTSATGITEGGQVVGTGTLGGSARAFLLTPPTDLRVQSGGVRSMSDSNLPRGVEVGKEIRFVVSVIATPDPITAYGARLTDTLTGPAEYVAVRNYEGTSAGCDVSPKIITCDVPPVDSIGMGQEYSITIRTTGPGTIAHTAQISSSVPDPSLANNSVSEANRSVALADLALTPSTLAGGRASSARITLTDIPPFSNDATVRLSSSRPDIAPVPSSLIVPNHNLSPSRSFNIIPKVVSAPTTVQITASYGLVTITRTLTVVPPALQQLYLTPTTVIGGCGTSAGKIVLTGHAPAGGAVVPLSNTNSMAGVASSVTVPAGTDRTTFTVTTKTVSTNHAGYVTAGYGGVSQTLKLTVRPIRVKTLTLTPNPATGGATVSGSLTLECAAPSGGIVVSLTSTNSSVAAPAVSSITIPPGGVSGSFAVRTSRVTASTAVTIYGTAYGVRKGVALTVRP